MKTISYITWGIIACYTLFAIFALISHIRHSSGMDAAGRGMSGGFLMIGIAFTIGLALLNLLPFYLTKILTLLIALSPFFYSVYSRTSQNIQSIRQANGSYYFEAEDLKVLAGFVRGKNLKKVEELTPMLQSDINQIAKTGETLLQMAIVENQYNMIWEGNIQKDNPALIQIIEVLLKNGADPNVHHPDKEPVLVYVNNFVSNRLLKLLLKYKADPNARNKVGIPVAASFIRKQDERSLEKLTLILDHGADPNIPFDYYGGDGTCSLLSMAADQQQWRICKLLLERGADPNFEPSYPYAKSLNSWLEYYKGLYAERGLAYSEDFKMILEKRKEYP